MYVKRFRNTGTSLSSPFVSKSCNKRKKVYVYQHTKVYLNIVTEFRLKFYLLHNGPSLSGRRILNDFSQ